MKLSVIAKFESGLDLLVLGGTEDCSPVSMIRLFCCSAGGFIYFVENTAKL